MNKKINDIEINDLNDNEIMPVLSEKIFSDAINLLKQLISTPSFSKEENRTADVIEKFLIERKVNVKRDLNNVWAVNKYFDDNKFTILLNSHHDTVKPNAGYTLDPFASLENEGKLFGLGSNDAGGALVSLISIFVHFYPIKNLPFNLVIAATAEEEISGHNGIEYLLPFLPNIDCGIVGEPTLMKMAVAEKGLFVLDCNAKGMAGHAARNEGINAIYIAMKDIAWFNNYEFDKTSQLLGPVHMAVTSIETANKAHNIIPSNCSFMVDIRVNELYSFEEILSRINENIKSDVKPRSTRLRPTFIENNHPLVEAGNVLQLESYGSPTCSDKALMPFPALKIGPGDSARSHMADEYIFINEIKDGITKYYKLLNNLVITKQG
ncbi:MAG: M20 family metallo-hydrolase [Ginsengibacter sp.]